MSVYGRTYTKYNVDKDGVITSYEEPWRYGGGKPYNVEWQGALDYSAALYNEAVQKSTDIKLQKIEQKQDEQFKLLDNTAKQNTYNSLSQQIAALTGGAGTPAGAAAGPAFNQALSQLSAGRNYGSSDLGSMLNFQVSDDQIVQDYNNSKLSRLNSVIERGNTQIAGINERLATANKLLADLPANSAQRTSSEVFIKQLNDDLKSVTSAVTGAQDMQKNFKPITMDSPEGLKEITALGLLSSYPKSVLHNSFSRLIPTPTALRLAWVSSIARWLLSQLVLRPRQKLSRFVRPSKTRLLINSALVRPLVRKNGVVTSNLSEPHRLPVATSLA